MIETLAHLSDLHLGRSPEHDAAVALPPHARRQVVAQRVHRPYHRLAVRDGWPPLYDPARLGANEVPAAAAIYFGDMYVDRDDSLRAAASIKGLRQWVTSEYEHDGVRVSGGRVLDRLIALTRGES